MSVLERDSRPRHPRLAARPRIVRVVPIVDCGQPGGFYNREHMMIWSRFPFPPVSAMVSTWRELIPFAVRAVVKTDGSGGGVSKNRLSSSLAPGTFDDCHTRIRGE